jgi:hypothetical protein
MPKRGTHTLSNQATISKCHAAFPLSNLGMMLGNSKSNNMPRMDVTRGGHRAKCRKPTPEYIIHEIDFPISIDYPSTRLR